MPVKVLNKVQCEEEKESLIPRISYYSKDCFTILWVRIKLYTLIISFSYYNSTIGDD